jgi:preprotein translocase subunit SecB
MTDVDKAIASASRGTDPIRVSAPVLRSLEFRRKTAETSSVVGEPPEVTVSFSISLKRISFDSLGIELGVTLVDHPRVEASAAYRAVFTIVEATPGVTSPGEVDARLAEIVRDVAPVALYPYIREAIGSASTRAGMDQLVLPIVDFRHFFAERQVAIPPVEEEVSTPSGKKKPAKRARKGPTTSG